MLVLSCLKRSRDSGTIVWARQLEMATPVNRHGVGPCLLKVYVAPTVQGGYPVTEPWRVLGQNREVTRSIAGGSSGLPAMKIGVEMGLITTYKCNVCGKYKEEVNHWWITYTNELDNGRLHFTVCPLLEKPKPLTGGKESVCSVECLQKRFSQYISKVLEGVIGASPGTNRD